MLIPSVIYIVCFNNCHSEAQYGQDPIQDCAPPTLLCTKHPSSLIWSFCAEQIGKGRLLAEGKDVALLGYGSMVQNCLKARSLLSKLGIEVTVADARFCKPLDIELLRQLCENHAFLVTVEEGSVGGFGSHVAQFIALDGRLDGRVKVIENIYFANKIPLCPINACAFSKCLTRFSVFSIMFKSYISFPHV